MGFSSFWRRNWPRFRGVASYGAGPVLGLLSGPILAYALGPSGRGQFAAIMQPITVAGAVACIGVPTAITYFVARGSMPRKRASRLGLTTAAVPTAIVLAAMAWYAAEIAVSQNIPIYVLWITWSTIAISVVVQIRRAVLNGLASWRQLDAERLIFAVLRFVVVALLAVLGVTQAATFAIGALCAFVAAALILWWPQSQPQTRPSGVVLPKAFISYSVTASIGTIAVVSNNRIDQVLMPIQTSSAELGFYAVAVTVAEVPLVLATLAGRNAIQLSGRGLALKLIVKDIGLYAGAGIALGIFLAVGAPWFVPILFGADFRTSIHSVQILTIATIAAIIAVVGTSIISGRGAPAISSSVPLSGLIVTALLFANSWGNVNATAAAWIAAASQGTSALVAICAVIYVDRRAAKRAGT